MMKPLTCGIPPTLHLWSNSDLLITYIGSVVFIGFNILLNQARAWFLEITFMRTSVCVRVCVCVCVCLCVRPPGY